MQDGVKRKPLRHLFVCRVSSLKLPAAVANIVPVSSLVADVLLSSSPAVAYVPLVAPRRRLAPQSSCSSHHHCLPRSLSLSLISHPSSLLAVSESSTLSQVHRMFDRHQDF